MPHQSLHKCAIAGSWELQAIVSKGLCLVSELLYFKILQIQTQIRVAFFKLQFLQ